MKKRKILVSIALASAALFSLSACGKLIPAVPGQGSQSQKEEAPKESSSSTPAQSSSEDTSSTQPSEQNTPSLGEGSENENQQSSENTQQSGEENPQQGGEENPQQGEENPQQGGEENPQQGETPVVVVKYSIDYVSEFGTKPAKKEEVTELTAEDLPTLKNTDNKFGGWFTDQSCSTPAQIGTLSSNVTLYAKWTAKTYYEKFVDVSAEKNTLVFSEDFSSTQTLAEYNASPAGLYQLASKKGAPKAGSSYTITIENGKAKANDNDSEVNTDDGNNNGKVQAITSFASNGVVKSIDGYFDLTFDVVAGNWTLVTFVGDYGTKTSTEVFGLRTIQDKSTKKTYLKYRVFGGDVADPETAIELKEDGTYGIYYSFDLSQSTITIKVVTKDSSGAETTNAFVTNKQLEGLVALRYSAISTSDKNSNVFSFDNIALNIVEYTVDEFKALVKAMAQQQLEAMAAYYTTNATEYEAWANKVIAAIESAQTIEELKDLYDGKASVMEEIQSIASDIQIAIVDAISSINTQFGVTKDNSGAYVVADYTINSTEFLTAYATAIENISKSKSVTEVNTNKENAITALSAIDNDTKAHDTYVATLMASLKTVYPETNYTETDSVYSNKTAYETAIVSKDTELASAVTKAEIAALFDQLAAALDEIDTNADLRAVATTALVEELDGYLATEIAGLDADTFASVIAEISSAKEDGAEAIEDATTVAEKRTALANAKSAIDSLYSMTQMTPEQALANAKSELTNYKATKLGSFTNENLTNSVNAVVLADDESTLDTVDKVNDALSAAKAEVNRLVAIYVNELAFDDVYGDKYIDLQNKNYDLSDELYIIIKSGLSAIRAAQSDVEAKDAYDEAVEEFDALYAQLIATEFDVVFKNTDLAATKFVFGNAIDEPQDPTKDGFVFAGWFEDDTLTTPYDFEKVHYDSFEIYAKWYDVYSVEENSTKSIIFKEVTKSDSSTTNVTANFKTSETFIVKDSNGKDYAFTTGAATNSGYVINSSKGLRMKNFDSNEYISFTLTGTASVSIVLNQANDAERGIAIYNGDTMYLSVVAAKSSVSGYDKGGEVKFDALTDISTAYKRTKNSSISISMANCPAGTYYIKIDEGHTGDLFITSISIDEAAKNNTAIAGITAYVTHNEGVIAVSSVKLLSADENPEEIEITDGYEVVVLDANGDEVTDIDSPLDFGTYKVIVKYGTYTVSQEYEVTIE